MKKILILIVSIGLVFGLIGVGTQSSFSDVETSRGNTFTAGVWGGNSGTYTITASANEGGSINHSGEVIVNKGDNQTFTIKPDTGYEIDDVSVDGESVGAVTSHTFADVQADHSIHATFVEEPDDTDKTEESVTYTITATADAGGSIEPSGEILVNKGDNQTFTIKPDTGYVIADVVVDEVTSVKEDLEGPDEYGGGTYTFTNVTQNHTIHATFEKIEYTITATADEGGSLDPSGDVTVNEGDNQTFNITPNAGYVIDGVLVDGESVGAVESYTFENVTGDHSIHAIFAEEPPTTYTITATKEGNGSISDEGVTTLNEGESKTYTITPDTGYVITDVSVDGESVGAVESYTFENVTGDHIIYAIFAEEPDDTDQTEESVTYSIAASADEGGSIDPSGDVTVNEGDNQSFNITPDTGYVIDGVLVDGGSVGAVDSYTFENVAGDHTIYATFKEDTND